MMRSDEGSEDQILTVREEIDKRYRDGQYYSEAILFTVTTRLGQVIRRSETSLETAREAARRMAFSVLEGALESGNSKDIACRSFQLAVMRACGDLDAEAVILAAAAGRSLFEQAFRFPIDPLDVALDLLLGTIQGARELKKDPGPFCDALARAILAVAGKHGLLLVRDIRTALRTGVDGVSFDPRRRSNRRQGIPTPKARARVDDRFPTLEIDSQKGESSPSFRPDLDLHPQHFERRPHDED